MPKEHQTEIILRGPLNMSLKINNKLYYSEVKYKLIKYRDTIFHLERVLQKVCSAHFQVEKVSLIQREFFEIWISNIYNFKFALKLSWKGKIQVHFQPIRLEFQMFRRLITILARRKN